MKREMVKVHGLVIYGVTLFLLPFFFINTREVGADIGVNYGLLGDNLPSPDTVITLCIARGIKRLRLFNPNAAALKSLHGSGIQIILGTLNADLKRLSVDLSFATSWVHANVLPHAAFVPFRYICVGNEVIPGNLSAYVLPAMKNLRASVKAANASVPVTTAVATVALASSYPPSQGAFSDEAASTMAPILSFLRAKKAPLLVNVYPYFAYAASPKEVGLDYALFATSGAVVHDGALVYNNLFDAMVDSLYSAVEKVGGSGVAIVVSETGWPSGGGGVGATTENAKAYNNNLLVHLKKGMGTPKSPGKAIETYLFAIFNENLKPAGIEQNFGLFQPDMSEVYHVDFT